LSGMRRRGICCVIDRFVELMSLLGFGWHWPF
jgi:hypothetical protein